MPTIHWNIETVQVNLPNVLSDRYPITLPSNISAEKIIKSIGIVNYCFCFSYNGGNILCNDYKISNNSVTIELPIGLRCVLEGNAFTISEIEPSADVTSVNGKTGEVVLKTSDIQNDSGYLTLETLPVYSGGVS